MSDTSTIYEIVDSTSEETYYPCGLFPTVQAALDLLTLENEPPGEQEDFAKFEIRERRVGIFDWADTGKAVAFVSFTDNLDGTWSQTIWRK